MITTRQKLRMLCVLKLLFLLMTTEVQGQGQDVEHVPRKCCTSHQFTALLSEAGQISHNGKDSSIDSYHVLTYDYDAKLTSLVPHVRDPVTGVYSPTDTRIVTDFNAVERHTVLFNGKARPGLTLGTEMMRYTIQYDGRSCFWDTITEHMQTPCVPDDATFLRTATLGSDHHGLRTNTWKITSPDHSNVTTKLVVSAHDCTPVTMDIYNNDKGVDSVVTYLISNFRPVIAHRSMLTIPSLCTPPNTPRAPYGEIGRR